MAIKTINTRIKNRIDSLVNWQAEGVELLPGEIALVTVNTEQVDANTGNIISVPAILMKVGQADADGNKIPFADLPWLSAKAADVYDWAKTYEQLGDVPVNVYYVESTGDNDVAKDLTQPLSTWLSGIMTKNYDNTVAIAALNDDIGVLREALDEAYTHIDDQVSWAVERLGFADSGTGPLVNDIEFQVDGTYVVNRREIEEHDLPDISASKIYVSTDDETGDPDKYLPAELQSIRADIASINTAIAGGVHFVGVVQLDPADNPTVGEFPLGGDAYEAATGDIIVYQEKEFIWDGTRWIELGDLTRVGTVEATLEKIKSALMAFNGGAGWVQIDNNFSVSKNEPWASDIMYLPEDATAADVETVADALDTHKTQIASINENTIWLDAEKNTLKVGKDSADVIIFDCGGAATIS